MRISRMYIGLDVMRFDVVGEDDVDPRSRFSSSTMLAHPVVKSGSSGALLRKL